MGQYHISVELDRRQTIEHYRLGSGAKLGEKLGGEAVALLALLLTGHRGDPALASAADSAVIGDWAGRRVLIVGDYAEDDDGAADLQLGSLYGAEDLTPADTRALRSVLETTTGIRLPADGESWINVESVRWSQRAVINADRLFPAPGDEEAPPPGDRDYLLVNLDLGEFVDPAALGQDRDLFSLLNCWDNAGLSAVLLGLLAVSDGRGGGDLHVPWSGRWAGHRLALVSRQTTAAELAAAAEPLGRLGVAAEELVEACFGGELTDISAVVSAETSRWTEARRVLALGQTLAVPHRNQEVLRIGDEPVAPLPTDAQVEAALSGSRRDRRWLAARLHEAARQQVEGVDELVAGILADERLADDEILYATAGVLGPSAAVVVDARLLQPVLDDPAELAARLDALLPTLAATPFGQDAPLLALANAHRALASASLGDGDAGATDVAAAAALAAAPEVAATAEALAVDWSGSWSGLLEAAQEAARRPTAARRRSAEAANA